MTLNKREKIYAALFGALAIVVLYCIWPSSQESLADLRKICEDKQKDVAKKQSELLEAQKAKARLTAWQARSLPTTDPKETALQYNGWLSALAFRYFKEVNVDSQQEPKQNAKKVYTLFSYTIKCQGTLGELVQFLHGFYSAAHLHKICSINFTPQKNSNVLKLDIRIEALSLPGSKQTDKLSTEKSNRLKLASVDEYKKPIADRNFFAVYKPSQGQRVDPPPRGPTQPARINPLQFSYLTAIIEADGIPEAWLFERTTGETVRVHEGEEFTIGKVKAKVNRIGLTDIEIEINGKTLTVGYGNNLKM
jgi:hypothetical protein